MVLVRSMKIQLLKFLLILFGSNRSLASLILLDLALLNKTDLIAGKMYV
jgi:hypothetical protein